jgi:hypothetical protein
MFVWTPPMALFIFIGIGIYISIHTNIINEKVILIYTELIIIDTYIPFTPKGQQRLLRYCSETPPFYHNYLAVRNTADVCGKPIAV